jgi:hypothetical protein
MEQRGGLARTVVNAYVSARFREPADIPLSDRVALSDTM